MDAVHFFSETCCFEKVYAAFSSTLLTYFGPSFADVMKQALSYYMIALQEVQFYIFKETC